MNHQKLPGEVTFLPLNKLEVGRSFFLKGCRFDRNCACAFETTLPRCRCTLLFLFFIAQNERNAQELPPEKVSRFRKLLSPRTIYPSDFQPFFAP